MFFIWLVDWLVFLAWACGTCLCVWQAGQTSHLIVFPLECVWVSEGEPGCPFLSGESQLSDTSWKKEHNAFKFRGHSFFKALHASLNSVEKKETAVGDKGRG